jgi:hypothetical protein
MFKLLCEGHHAAFQNYLRERTKASTQVNLVKRLTDIVVFLCDSSFVVSRFTRIELRLVSQLLDTLVEVTQGPCPGNQAVLFMHVRSLLFIRVCPFFFSFFSFHSKISFIIHVTNTRYRACLFVCLPFFFPCSFYLY